MVCFAVLKRKANQAVRKCFHTGEIWLGSLSGFRSKLRIFAKYAPGGREHPKEQGLPRSFAPALCDCYDT
jgi:hypothetical protein